MKEVVRILVLICLSSQVCDLWAMEGSEDFRYSGWIKSTLDGRGPSVKESPDQIEYAGWKMGPRGKMEYVPNEVHSFEGAYEFSFFYSKIKNSGFTRDFGETFKYRIYDLESKLDEHYYGNGASLNVYQNLDRLFYTNSGENHDLYIGRQPISFGTGRFINPTDVLVPYAVTSIDKEEREGVDAIRFKRPIGYMGEFDLGLVAGDEGKNENNAFYAAIHYPIKSFDTSFLMMRFKKHNLAGINFQGAIKEAGVWFEGAFIDVSDGYDDYSRITVGTEYNFTSNFYGFMEYHFNGAGVNSENKYLINASSIAYQDGGVYLLSKNYLVAGLVWQITPLINFAKNNVVNLNDGSILISPRFEWNFVEDHYFDFGGFLGFGKRSKSPLLRIESEFGIYSQTFYLTYRGYL